MVLQLDFFLESNDLPDFVVKKITEEIYEQLLESKQALAVAEQIKADMDTKMSIDDILYDMAVYNAERQVFGVQKVVNIVYRRN